MIKKINIRAADFLHLEAKSLNISKFEKKATPKSANLNFRRESQQVFSSPFLDHVDLKTTEEGKELEEARIEEIKAFASFNEMIVYQFNKLKEIDYYFSIPIFAEDDEEALENIENLNTSIGTYGNLIHEAESQGILKETLDAGFDILEAQKFAILQLLIKGEDTHGGNIIIQINPNNHLVPILVDFGRCLGYNPNDEHMLPRTTRWEKWPALHYPLETELKEFILHMEIESIMESLKSKLQEEYNEELTERQLDIIQKKMDHLEANLLMIKEATINGLTVKQMIALIIPEVDRQTFNFVTEGILQGGSLWPARKRYASLESSFLKAWNITMLGGRFDKELFSNAIQIEIERIKELPATQLEKQYFPKISYELRRGLYL